MGIVEKLKTKTIDLYKNFVIFLKKMLYDVELFLRGEFYLHFATMFIIQSMVLKTGFVTIGYVLPIILGASKEIYDVKKGKEFSTSDSIGSILGGYYYMFVIHSLE